LKPKSPDPHRHQREEKAEVPNEAHDRLRRGPFAALLILLGLILSSGTVTAGASMPRASAARQSSDRAGAAVLITRSEERSAFPGDAPEPNSFAPPASPGIVTSTLWARPTAPAALRAGPAFRQPAHRSYRARAPPAV
jgi:hypothetical protein